MVAQAKRVLFLDDRSKRLHAALKKYAPPKYDLTLVCNNRECIRYLNRSEWDILSLDYDLDGTDFQGWCDRGSTTSMRTLDFLKDSAEILKDRIGVILIHTARANISLRMRNFLKGAGYNIKIERFEYGD